MTQIQKRAADRIGLQAGPWRIEDNPWPTYGYDGMLASLEWPEGDGPPKLLNTTRADWLTLADEMVARWTAFRAWVDSLPDDIFPEKP